MSESTHPAGWVFFVRRGPAAARQDDRSEARTARAKTTAATADSTASTRATVTSGERSGASHSFTVGTPRGWGWQGRGRLYRAPPRTAPVHTRRKTPHVPAPVGLWIGTAHQNSQCGTPVLVLKTGAFAAPRLIESPTGG